MDMPVFHRRGRTLRDRSGILMGAYPEAKVVQEVFTGTNYKDRKRLKEVVRRVKADDTIVV